MNAFLVVLVTVIRAANPPESKRQRRLRKRNNLFQPHVVCWIRERRPQKDMTRFCRMAACAKRRRIVH